MGNRLPILVMLPYLAGALGCSDQAQQQASARVSTTAITWGPPIRLQEDEQSIVVRPHVSIDPMGGFLVADAAEAQIRRYARSGSLIWRTGKRGQGPGEYQQPVSVTRLHDGKLVVLDYYGRATILGPRGQYQQSVSLPFSRVEGAVGLDDAQLLVSGVSTEALLDKPLLHVVDLGHAQIRLSFLPLPETVNRVVARMMGYAVADVRGDTVVAAYAGLDSVFVYTLDGRLQRAFAIPVDNFRVVEEGPPATTDPVRRQEYFGTFETVSGIWWVGSQYIAVLYKTVVPGGFAWHWALMTNGGELVHQQRNSSRLLSAYSDRPALLAVSPETEVPNTWREINIGSGP